MNKFRKPYVSCILALLMLFVSCQSPTVSEDDNLILQKKQYTLKSLVTDNLISSEIISNLLNKNSNINLELLENNGRSITTEADLRALLTDANVVNVDEFVFALLGIQQNIEKFVKNNSSFLEITQEEQLEKVINEIQLQLSNSKNYPKSDCWDDRVEAENKCARNWVISMGIATISGVVSLGWGTAIGFVGAQAQVAICLSEAVDEFLECQRRNEGQ